MLRAPVFVGCPLLSLKPRPTPSVTCRGRSILYLPRRRYQHSTRRGQAERHGQAVAQAGYVDFSCTFSHLRIDSLRTFSDRSLRSPGAPATPAPCDGRAQAQAVAWGYCRRRRSVGQVRENKDAAICSCTDFFSFPLLACVRVKVLGSRERPHAGICQEEARRSSQQSGKESQVSALLQHCELLNASP